MYVFCRDRTGVEVEGAARVNVDGPMPAVCIVQLEGSGNAAVAQVQCTAVQNLKPAVRVISRFIIQIKGIAIQTKIDSAVDLEARNTLDTFMAI